MGAILEINGIETNYVKDIANLENLLVYADNLGHIKDEIIIETKIDGETYSEEYPHQSKDVNLKRVQKVEIKTQAKKDFAENFIKKIPVFIEQLNDGFNKASELLKDKKMEHEGYHILSLSLGVLRSFKNHIDNVRVVLGRKDNVKKNEENDIMYKFGSIADEIIAAQEINDKEKIANLLERDLKSILEEWKIILCEN